MLAAALAAAAAGALPGLPRLHIVGAISVSGISSGADFAASFHVANSDLVNASGIFAGQAPLCAVQRFAGEPQFSCAAQPYGPGCVGLAATGPAPCVGCDAGMTLTYDHCKEALQGLVQVPQLLGLMAAAAAEGRVPPLDNLAGDAVYLYRGTADTVYQAGAVNHTQAYFAALGSATTFEATVPSAHCMPTVDPAVSPASCGGKHAPAGTPPAMENCGFDGAGAALQHAFQGSLVPPPPAQPFTDAAHVLAFNQSRYFGAVWPALASVGFAYVPAQCAAGAACRLHAAFHGCGMSALTPAMALNYTFHAGYNQWAALNDMVVLYPQGGGCIERNATCGSPELDGGCWDGYGQTGPAYAFTQGPQAAAVRAMLLAVAGGADSARRR